MPHRLSHTLLLLVALTVACRAQEPAGMSREKFVRVNVALRLLPDSGANVAARRAAILRREHVTAAQLEDWVRTRRASTLTRVWQEIAGKVDSSRTSTRRPRPASGTQVGVPLPPPPATGGPQDSVLRPGAVRPTPDTAAPVHHPFRAPLPADTAM